MLKVTFPAPSPFQGEGWGEDSGAPAKADEDCRRQWIRPLKVAGRGGQPIAVQLKSGTGWPRLAGPRVSTLASDLLPRLPWFRQWLTQQVLEANRG